MNSQVTTYIILIFSMPWLIVGGIHLKKSLKFYRNSLLVESDVIGQKDRPATANRGRNSSGRLWAPIIKFRTLRGEFIELTLSNYSSHNGAPCYPVGSKIRVRYLADNPEGARLDSLLGIFWLPAFLLLGGFMFLSYLVI